MPHGRHLVLLLLLAAHASRRRRRSGTDAGRVVVYRLRMLQLVGAVVGRRVVRWRRKTGSGARGRAGWEAVVRRLMLLLLLLLLLRVIVLLTMILSKRVRVLLMVPTVIQVRLIGARLRQWVRL